MGRKIPRYRGFCRTGSASILTARETERIPLTRWKNHKKRNCDFSRLAALVSCEIPKFLCRLSLLHKSTLERKNSDVQTKRYRVPDRFALCGCRNVLRQRLCNGIIVLPDARDTRSAGLYPDSACVRAGLHRNWIDPWDALYGATCGPVFLTNGQPGCNPDLPGRLGNAPDGSFGARTGAYVVDNRCGYRCR
jgi:hypothetical protein